MPPISLLYCILLTSQYSVSYQTTSIDHQLNRFSPLLEPKLPKSGSATYILWLYIVLPSWPSIRFFIQLI